MQLIAEAYDDLMKRGLGLNDDELHEVYSAWNTGDLSGYLLEITSHFFRKRTSRPATYRCDSR
jgi:6-phosphogluconate dehydrogenase